jgi:hypothetical protein
MGAREAFWDVVFDAHIIATGAITQELSFREAQRQEIAFVVASRKKLADPSLRSG